MEHEPTSSADRVALDVLIVDDHAVVRAGLRMLLESRERIGQVVEAADREQALTAAQSLDPDIVLLDLDLGGERSLGWLPDLLNAASAARVLILTGLRDLEVHEEAVRRGAVGVVLKDEAAETLLTAIDRVAAGEVWLGRGLTARVLGQLTRPAKSVTLDEQRIARLTEREREIVGLVGEGLRNKEIAQRLFLSETTVRHHLTSVFAKLDVEDRLSLAIYAFRHGLARLPG